jgi:hypothetical protein
VRKVDVLLLSVTLSGGSVAVLGAGSEWRHVQVRDLPSENTKLVFWQKQVRMFKVTVSFSIDSHYVRYVKTCCLCG